MVKGLGTTLQIKCCYIEPFVTTGEPHEKCYIWTTSQHCEVPCGTLNASFWPERSWITVLKKSSMLSLGFFPQCSSTFTGLILCSNLFVFSVISILDTGCQNGSTEPLTGAIDRYRSSANVSFRRPLLPPNMWDLWTAAVQSWRSCHAYNPPQWRCPRIFSGLENIVQYTRFMHCLVHFCTTDCSP